MYVGRLVATILVVWLAAAGCSSAETAQPADSAPAGDSVVVATGEPLPFDAVLMELFGTTDTDRYLDRTEQQAAELVVECMVDAGFEFQIPPVTASVPPDVAADPVSVAATEGFGIIADFLRSTESTDFTAIGIEDQANLDYLATLSGPEVQRFFMTLDGVEAEPGQEQTETGCNGQASDEAYGDWIRFSEALPNFRSMAEERDSHPDWLAARSEWQVCIAERGFDYAEPRAIESDVTSRMRAIVVDAYPDGELPLVESPTGLILDPVVQELLDDMMAFEIEAAVADAECTAPLAGRFEAVDRQVQQGFVDRNQATIDQLLAS